MVIEMAHQLQDPRLVHVLKSTLYAIKHFFKLKLVN
jgi:hypothetical protein